MLNVGWIIGSAGRWRRGEPMDRQIRLPVPAYVIETGDARILVDTGLHPGLISDPARHYRTPGALARFGFEQEASIADQVDLSTITSVVLTHLHFDHASALPLLPASIPIVMQRREWEGAHDPAVIAACGYLSADYLAIADRVVLVDGDHDLLGDGSIELLLTPGHTPGHQSLRIGDSLVLGGDVAYFEATLEDRRLPLAAASHTDQLASVERLRALRRSGFDVRPGHDPDVLVPGPVAVSPRARQRSSRALNQLSRRRAFDHPVRPGVVR